MDLFTGPKSPSGRSTVFTGLPNIQVGGFLVPRPIRPGPTSFGSGTTYNRSGDKRIVVPPGVVLLLPHPPLDPQLASAPRAPAAQLGREAADILAGDGPVPAQRSQTKSAYPAGRASRLENLALQHEDQISSAPVLSFVGPWVAPGQHSGLREQILRGYTSFTGAR